MLDIEVDVCLEVGLVDLLGEVRVGFDPGVLLSLHGLDHLVHDDELVFLLVFQFSAQSHQRGFVVDFLLLGVFVQQHDLLGLALELFFQVDVAQLELVRLSELV